MREGFLACGTLPGVPKAIPAALARALDRHGLHRRTRVGGWTLYADPEIPVRTLAGGTGLVTGDLFDSSGQPAPKMPTGCFSPSGAEAFTARYWGSYVGLGVEPAGLTILRDPSGGLPCYRAAAGGIHYLTSLPHLLVDGAVAAAEFDWKVILKTLTRQDDRECETAIRSIGEVLPGTLLGIGRGRTDVRSAWDPWRHAARPASPEPQSELLDVISAALRAWTLRYRRPLVEVSGGLDSALVAAAASAAGADLSLITFAAAPGDPDETGYARAIAQHLSLPLEVARPRVDQVDLTRSSSRNLPRPNARAFTQAADAQSLNHARRLNANCFMSGGGGDDVFCYLRTVLPALDRLEAEGMSAMARTARDIAVMDHATFWDALARIARRLVRGASALQPADLRFLRAGVRAPDLPAPARDRDRIHPRGKTEHVRSILTIHNHLEGHERSDFAPILSPLLSQPVVECCLSIPSWLWCEGGQNRAVARRAFAGRLPRIVLERRSKGAFDGFSARLLHVNRPLLLDMLADGQLVANGLVDRDQVVSALGNPSPPGDQVGRLLALANVEAWVRSWTERRAQRG